MRAAIYARYSSDLQSDRSIEDQVRLCRETAARDGLTVAAVYEDRAISGASLFGRNGILRLLADVGDHRFDVVLTESLDRLSRSQRDLADIHQRLEFAGIGIRTLADGKVDEMHVGLKGLMSALFLKDLAAKTRRGMQGLIAQGKFPGGQPYGYRARPGATGELEIVEAEAVIVREIFRRYATGEGMAAIVRDLNARAVPAPRGRSWRVNSVMGSAKRQSGILVSEIYAGRLVWGRMTYVKDPSTGRRVPRMRPEAEWRRVDVPALRLVDDETWERVQAIRAGRADAFVRHAPGARPARHLLSGLVRCGTCGGAYHVGGRTRHGKSEMRCVEARAKKCDNSKRVTREALEAVVLDTIRDRLLTPAVTARYVAAYRAAWAEARAADDRQRAARLRRLQDVERATAQIVTAVEQGADWRPFAERLRRLEAERAALEAEAAAELPAVADLHPRLADHYERRVAALRETMARGSADRETMEIIRQLVERVVVLPGRPYAPAAVEIHGQLANMIEPHDVDRPARWGVRLVAGGCNSGSPRPIPIVFTVSTGARKR